MADFDGTEQTDGFNDVELTTFNILSVDTLLIQAGSDLNDSNTPQPVNVKELLIAAVDQANNIDTFNVDEYLIPSGNLPAILNDSNLVTSQQTIMYVENQLHVSGMNPYLFLGGDSAGAAGKESEIQYNGAAITFDGHDPGNGKFENDVYVTDELYLYYDTQEGVDRYILLSAAMAAMQGLLTAVLDINPVKRSLHKFGYTLEFDVDAGINVTVEDYNPDIILEGSALTLHTDCQIFISDNINDPITSTCTIANFELGTDVDLGKFTTVTKSGANVTGNCAQYGAWLQGDMTSNNLFKGLFGELLAESPIVSAFRDSNNEMVADDLFELVVERPGKLTLDTQIYLPGQGENAPSGPVTYTSQYDSNNPWLDQYFKLEHTQLMNELSAAFVNVWSNTTNIDWYVTAFNIKESGPLFNTGNNNTPDTFRVPVDVTFNYEIVNANYDTDTLVTNSNTPNDTDLTASLDPMAFEISNLVDTNNDGLGKIQKTYRLEYVFNVTNIP